MPSPLFTEGLFFNERAKLSTKWRETEDECDIV